ncbi:MAG: hypothetical protein JWN07_2901 [Hyphomicrobiales bacterium]|nr:hypothetical protein [Hyphomicrobiales bacterium]
MARIAVAGVGRNIAASFSGEVRRIETALAGHDLARFIVVESDSTDDSPTVLRDWANTRERNTYIGLPALEAALPSRTQRIAYCRNVYLDYLRHAHFMGAEYLFVTDLDGVNAELTGASIGAAVAALQSGFAGAGANQSDRYYDIWALRHPIWSPNDCWMAFEPFAAAVGRVNAHEILNRSRMLNLPTDLAPIEVESAFGGGALYDVRMLEGCAYDGIAGGREVCEHVAFSNALRRNGGRLAVVPGFINHGASEHVASADLFAERGSSASQVS